MGLWDRMFGTGATIAQAVPQAMETFTDLKAKYQPVLDTIHSENVRLTTFQVQDNKLLIQGVAPSEDAKNKVWDKIKEVDANYADLQAEISVEEAPAATPSQTYKVESGDSLWKISKKFYGDGDEYMRIFYANKDKIKDPDLIQVGWELVIPEDDTPK